MPLVFNSTMTYYLGVVNACAAHSDHCSSFTCAQRCTPFARSDNSVGAGATVQEGHDWSDLHALVLPVFTERNRMSTLLLQEWCAARLNSLCLISDRMAAQAESFMTEEAAIQAGLRQEAAIIEDVCSRHKITLASLVRELSVSADLGGMGDGKCCRWAADLESEQADQPMLRSLSKLCDLRATMTSAQFSCDELGSALGVLGLSNYRDDLYWLRDECAAHNRRLETLVISHQAQLVASSSTLQQVPGEPTNPLMYSCVAGQMASFHDATDKTVQEAC